MIRVNRPSIAQELTHLSSTLTGYGAILIDRGGVLLPARRVLSGSGRCDGAGRPRDADDRRQSTTISSAPAAGQTRVSATWRCYHSIQLRDGAELINAGTLSVATVGEHHLFSHAGGGTFTNTAAGTITKLGRVGG